MARTIGRLMRYFIAKWHDGPILIVADRIDAIRRQLAELGLDGQFHPSYTRMVPAHHVVRIELVGCPDPNPIYDRFFSPAAQQPARGRDRPSASATSLPRIARSPAGSTACRAEPVGVCFSGGIDSGAVFLLTYHALLQRGESPARLKAFTLAVDGGGADLEQARRIPAPARARAIPRADSRAAGRGAHRRRHPRHRGLQAARRAIRRDGAGACAAASAGRYPEWKYLLDGDGGDENLKDYPIEDNPELTIRSVLNNLMLYQEGWGVNAIKHSLTYSGGQSRGYARTYAPLAATGFMRPEPVRLPVGHRGGGGHPVHRADRLGPRTALRVEGPGRRRRASRR